MRAYKYVNEFYRYLLLRLLILVCRAFWLPAITARCPLISLTSGANLAPTNARRFGGLRSAGEFSDHF